MLDWESEARLSITGLNLRFWYVLCIHLWQSSKRSMRVHPRRLLKNVNISAGTGGKLGEKTFKIMLGELKNVKELGRQNGRDVHC